MNTRALFDNAASRTLLIPLVVRAKEGKHPASLFTDKVAEEVVARLPAQTLNFSIHPFMRTGTAIRVRYFDDLAKDMLNKSEQPVIVQLGCGLDTRFSRIDSGKGIHVNIDLPEVMAMRKQVLPPNDEREVDWSGDLLERDWMDRLEQEYAGSQFMFMAEGVLMYLAENDVRKLISDIADRFPGSHIVFDTAGKVSASIINRRSAVTALKASLTWIYDDNERGVDMWHPRLRRQERAYYFNRFRSRWGILCLVHFTRMGRSSAMFHFQIEK